MTLSLLEGLLSAGYFAFLERWLMPLLHNRLGADRQTLAMVLSNLPMLSSVVMGAIMGLVVHRLGGSRRTTLVSVWLQTLALACLLPPQFFPAASWCVPMALSAACAMGLAGTIGQTSWQAWMSELVPPAVQGRYFGRRSMAFSVAGMVYVGLYAQIIVWLPCDPGPAGGDGLLLISVLALVVRLLSAVTLTLQPGVLTPERPLASWRQTWHDLWHFIRHAPRHESGPWMMLMTAMMVGIGMSAPFIVMYQTAPLAQGGLALTGQPLLYAAIFWSAAVVRLSTYPLLGRAVDRFGPRAVLRWALPGMAIIPLFWALITQPWMLLFSEMIAALCWCGVDCAVTMLLWNCHGDARERPRIMGYQQALTGSALLLGGLLGTVLIEMLPTLNGSAFRSLFLVSFLYRAVVAIVAFRILVKRPARA